MRYYQCLICGQPGNHGWKYSNMVKRTLNRKGPWQPNAEHKNTEKRTIDKCIMIELLKPEIKINHWLWLQEGREQWGVKHLPRTEAQDENEGLLLCTNNASPKTEDSPTLLTEEKKKVIGPLGILPSGNHVSKSEQHKGHLFRYVKDSNLVNGISVERKVWMLKSFRPNTMLQDENLNVQKKMSYPRNGMYAIAVFFASLWESLVRIVYSKQKQQ